MPCKKVGVDSVYGNSPGLCSKKELLKYLHEHSTTVSDLALTVTGIKAVLVEG